MSAELKQSVFALAVSELRSIVRAKAAKHAYDEATADARERMEEILRTLKGTGKKLESIMREQAQRGAFLEAKGVDERGHRWRHELHPIHQESLSQFVHHINEAYVHAEDIGQDLFDAARNNEKPFKYWIHREAVRLAYMATRHDKNGKGAVRLANKILAAAERPSRGETSVALAPRATDAAAYKWLAQYRQIEFHPNELRWLTDSQEL